MNKNTTARLASIDILRGFVMVLMTLDHTRDFFSDAHFKPTDLDKTSVALFLTRWLTHFCAPVFVFLAGTSAYLWQQRRGPEASISRLLLMRGLLLLILTCTVEAWAWDFHNDFRRIDGGVLWAIAWSMIVLAGLVRLPLISVVTFGGLLIAVHNGFDGWRAVDLGALGPLWSVLHTGEKVTLIGGWAINPFYPLIPWIGVMAVGYGFGHWMTLDRQTTCRYLLIAGSIMVLLFVLLRFSNSYGDPDPWGSYPEPIFTLLSFINCHKYPPSLLYLLMTLGPALLLLAGWLMLPNDRFARLQVFGRTPLLFYLLHLYLIHGLALLIAIINHDPVATLMAGGIWLPEIPENYGYGLPVVYLLWLLVLLMLYPVCRGFEALKRKKPHWRWLNYL